MSLEFKVEWLDCPTPDVPLLAKTWGRLEIRLNGMPLTQVRERATDIVRDGVYGSVLPMAAWLASNFWYLLEEPGGAAGHPPDLAWLHRHWLRAGASGYSLPSLTLFRQGESVLAAAAADPAVDDRWPVQFLVSCQEALPPAMVGSAIVDFLRRVESRLADDDSLEARQFRAAVERVRAGSAQEAWLYEACAAWGLDPDDPADVPDDLAAFMTDHLAGLPEPIREDLTLAAAPAGWAPGFEWLAGKVEMEALDARFAPALNWNVRSLAGAYDLACAVRGRLNGGAAAAPEEAARRLGIMVEAVEQPAAATGLVAAMVEVAGRGLALKLAPRREPLQRFELGRALFFREAGLLVGGPRLLTRSRDQLEQRLSRAFAAELWAPAAVLRERIGPSRNVEESEIESLADEFGVSPLVVAHQLENHGLGVPVLG